VRDKERNAGSGVWMWWADGSRTDDGRVGATVVCSNGDSWTVFCSHLGTGRKEVFDTELWAIGIALRKSVARAETLTTHGVTRVAIFSDSQAAIRQMTHLDPGPGPGQPLARVVNDSARVFCDSYGIKVEIHWVLGHSGIPGNEQAD